MKRTKEGQPLSGEDLAEAYITNNIVSSGVLIDAEIQAWQASLKEPHASEVHINGEIQRLSKIKGSVAALIEKYRVEEPIDIGFVLELGGHLDATEADFDTFGQAPSPDAEVINVLDAVEELKVRNQPPSLGRRVLKGLARAMGIEGGAQPPETLDGAGIWRGNVCFDKEGNVVAVLDGDSPFIGPGL